MGLTVELGVPTGWPVRLDDDYEFGLDVFSAQLIADIEAWAGHFNREYHYDEGGWSSHEAKDRHNAQGERLAVRIRSELGDAYTVKIVTMQV